MRGHVGGTGSNVRSKKVVFRLSEATEVKSREISYSLVRAPEGNALTFLNILST